MTTTINFLQRDEKTKKKSESIKAIVIPATTAVMVVYLILVSSLLGWWWWWSSKQQRVSQEYISLKSQIDSKQQAEVIARRMIDRVKVIENYLQNRKDIYAQSEFLVNQPFDVTGFGLADEGYFFAKVTATESADVAGLEEELNRRYENIMINKMVWDKKEGAWSATYWYEGQKI